MVWGVSAVRLWAACSSFGEGGESRIALPYVAMGIVVLVVALIFTRVRLPEITSEPEVADAKAEPLPPTVRQRMKRLSANRFYLFGVLALFSYEVAEIGINSFFINYVTDYGYMNARDASIAPFVWRTRSVHAGPRGRKFHHAACQQ